MPYDAVAVGPIPKAPDVLMTNWPVPFVQNDSGRYVPVPLIPDTNCTSVEPFVAIRILDVLVGSAVLVACQEAAVAVPLGSA